jgi:hypothetical protein
MLAKVIAAMQAPRRQAIGARDGDVACCAIDAHVRARDPHRDRIDVARHHLPMQRPRRRDRQHAGAGSDVEDGTRAGRAPLERQEAAARGAMVAGAEGERGFDLDRDAVSPHIVTMVCRVNDEAAGRDRPQAFEACLHPVPGQGCLERDRMGGVGPGRERDQSAHGGLVRRLAKMDGDAPAARSVLARPRDRRQRVKAFGRRIDDPPRRGLIRREARDRRRLR